MVSVASDGTRYEVSGPEDGLPVALVHGLGLNRHMWQWQQPELAKRYRVIQYDLRGHGESMPVESPSLTKFAQQLHGVLSDIGVDRAAIVGFSLGGMIARRFAMDYPDCVSAICILHSPHRRTADQQAAVAKRLVETTAGGAQATVDGALQRWLSDTFRVANPETVDMVRRWVMANDNAVYPTNYAVLCHGVEELIAPNPPIACPALVVTGTEDPGQPPAMAEAIAAEIEGAQVEILPGLRHMGFTEQPELYNGLLFDFLDRLNAGGSDGD